MNKKETIMDAINRYGTIDDVPTSYLGEYLDTVKRLRKRAFIYMIIGVLFFLITVLFVYFNKL